jgi:hypothetical protein
MQTPGRAGDVQEDVPAQSTYAGFYRLYCTDLHFCEATEDVFQAPFDENGCNDWNKVSLRKRLNGEFLDALIAECPDLKNAIVPTYRDLTADDGLRDYGNCLDKVTMLTADEYR